MAMEIVPHHVIILELLEQADFSNGSAWDTFVFCFQSNLLEGNDFVGGHIAGLVHNAVSSWENNGGSLDGRWPGLQAQDTFACGAEYKSRRARMSLIGH